MSVRKLKFFRLSRSLSYKHSARPKIPVQGKIPVRGKTRKDVEDVSLTNSLEGREFAIRRDVCLESKRLFDYFIPKQHDEDSAAVQLFWGALHEIIVWNRGHVIQGHN